MLTKPPSYMCGSQIKHGSLVCRNFTTARVSTQLADMSTCVSRSFLATPLQMWQSRPAQLCSAQFGGGGLPTRRHRSSRDQLFAAAGLTTAGCSRCFCRETERGGVTILAFLFCLERLVGRRVNPDNNKPPVAPWKPEKRKQRTPGTGGRADLGLAQTPRTRKLLRQGLYSPPVTSPRGPVSYLKPPTNYRNAKTNQWPIDRDR